MMIIVCVCVCCLGDEEEEKSKRQRGGVKIKGEMGELGFRLRLETLGCLGG